MVPKDVTCPRCFASPGERCVVRGARSNNAHQPRNDRAEAHERGPQDDDRVFVDGKKYHVVGNYDGSSEIQLRESFRKVVVLTITRERLTFWPTYGCWAADVPEEIIAGIKHEPTEPGPAPSLEGPVQQQQGSLF